MRNALLTWLSWMTALGIEPFKMRAAIKGLPLSVREHFELRRQNAALAERWHINLRSPNFDDRFSQGGIASGHYFHQDLLVAQCVYERNPEKHVDVGSRVDGFVAHVATFREIEVFDIRPNSKFVRNIVFRHADIMSADVPEEYCDSLSCLHALEHFGLGRYGDPINVEGYLAGINALAKMLKSGGVLYLSVPIGIERIEFNGQRIFSIDRILRLVEESFTVKLFSYIDDNGDLHRSVEIDDQARKSNFDLTDGCGIFELIKN